MFHFKNLFLVHLFCNSFPSCGSLQLQKMEFHFGLLARQGRIWNRKLSSLTPYYPKTNTSHTGVPGSIPSTSRSNPRAVWLWIIPNSNHNQITEKYLCSWLLPSPQPDKSYILHYCQEASWKFFWQMTLKKRLKHFVWVFIPSIFQGTITASNLYRTTNLYTRSYILKQRSTSTFIIIKLSKSLFSIRILENKLYCATYMVEPLPRK